MKITLQALQADCIAVCVVATTSLCVGLLINQFRDSPLPLVYQSKEQRVLTAVDQISSSPSPVSITEVAEYLGLEEFQEIRKSNEAIILDARPEIFHRLGHIPSALSLPREDFENAFAQHRNQLEKDKAGLIVVYCSGSSCEDSDLVRKGLHRLGFSRVSVFKGGWSAWTSAGLPEERTP